MRVHGVSLHLFDDDNNHDKFYRAFVWRADDGAWQVTCHWGRDGAPRGQVQTTGWNSLADADAMLRKKVDEKIRKGYEYLGQGEIELSDALLRWGGADHEGLSVAGHRLHSLVGRTPTKLVGGFTLVIREEDYIEDLI